MQFTPQIVQTIVTGTNWIDPETIEKEIRVIQRKIAMEKDPEKKSTTGGSLENLEKELEQKKSSLKLHKPTFGISLNPTNPKMEP